MKKTLLTISALALMQGSALAAVTNGQLTFNWQGVVPTSPVTQTNWAFIDGLNLPFTPVTEQLNIVVDSATKDVSITSAKPYDFYIAPVTGAIKAGTPVTRDTNATMNSVNAFLASTPVSKGFVGNKQLILSGQAKATTGQVAINLNGQPLKVGSTSPTTITVNNNKEAHITMEVNAAADAASVNEGASLSFVAPVTFAVDI